MLTFKNFTLLNDSEHEELLEIRNDDYVRFNMNDSRKIPLEEHFNFVNNLKESATKTYYSIFSDKQLIGAVYLTQIDQSKKECFLGFYFKNSTNPLLSSLAVYIFLEYCFNEKGFKTIYLEVLESNKNALNFNTNFGFTLEKTLFQEKKQSYLMKCDLFRWNEKKNSKILLNLEKKLNKIQFIFQGEMR